jgi:hypothetical protein
LLRAVASVNYGTEVSLIAMLDVYWTSSKYRDRLFIKIGHPSAQKPVQRRNYDRLAGEPPRGTDVKGAH